MPFWEIKKIFEALKSTQDDEKILWTCKSSFYQYNTDVVITTNTGISSAVAV